MASGPTQSRCNTFGWTVIQDPARFMLGNAYTVPYFTWCKSTLLQRALLLFHKPTHSFPLPPPASRGIYRATQRTTASQAERPIRPKPTLGRGEEGKIRASTPFLVIQMLALMQKEAAGTQAAGSHAVFVLALCWCLPTPLVRIAFSLVLKYQRKYFKSVLRLSLNSYVNFVLPWQFPFLQY